MADATLVDLVKITALTTGTGAVTLGDAVPGYRGVEALLDGAVYGYSIQQEAEYEIGRCTYLQTSNQIVRTPEFTSNGGTPINLQANASIAFVATAEDILGRDVLRPLYGYGAPTNNIGLIGQVYTDLNVPVTLYGPKTATGWGTGVVLQGDAGTPGTAASYTSLTALRAADPAALFYALITPTGLVNYGLQSGNFTGQVDNDRIVKLDAVALSVGALVKQGATSINFDGRSVDTKLLEIPSVTDKRFAGGAIADAVYDAGSATGPDSATGTNNKAAFEAAFATGKPFIVPPGNYYITSLDVTADNAAMIQQEGSWIYAYPGRYVNNGQALSGIRFRGDGWSITGTGNPENCGIHILGDSEAVGVFSTNAAGRCVLSKITIRRKPFGDTAIDDDTYMCPVNFLNASGSNPSGNRLDGIAEDCIFEGFSQYGGQHYGDLSGGAVRRCKIRKNGRPAQVASRGSGWAVTRGVSNLVIEDNDFEDNKEYGVLGSSAGLNSDQIKIHNNRFSNCGRGGGSWTEETNLASDASHGTTRLSVTGNSFVNCGKDTSYTSGRADFRIGTFDGVGFIKYFTIENNRHDGSAPYNILIQSNSVEANAVSDGKIASFMNIGPDTILGLGIGAGVLRVSHYNTYFGSDASKYVQDNQANVTPITTFGGGWANAFGSPFKPTSYETAPTGEVIISFQIAGGANGEAAFVMPAGKRPQYALPIFSGQGSGQINTDGSFVVNSGTGAFAGSVRYFPYAR
jgi:hypothetical protein